MEFAFHPHETRKVFAPPEVQTAPFAQPIQAQNLLATFSPDSQGSTNDDIAIGGFNVRFWVSSAFSQYIFYSEQSHTRS